MSPGGSQQSPQGAAGMAAGDAERQEEPPSEGTEVLLDMSPLDGLPPAAIGRLVTLFYNDAVSGAPIKLAAIEADLVSGVAVKDPGMQHSLHQLVGASLQSGAKAFAMSVRAFKENPPEGKDLQSGEIDRLRKLLDASDRAAHERGYF